MAQGRRESGEPAGPAASRSRTDAAAQDAAAQRELQLEPQRVPALAAGPSVPPGDLAAPLAQAGGGRLARAGGALRRLQESYGNRYVQQVVRQANAAAAPVVQAKLVLGPAADKYEREADRVAEEVTGQGPGSAEETAQKAALEADSSTGAAGEGLLRKAADPPLHGPAGGAVAPGVQQAIEGARGGGQPLAGRVRAQMEGALGTDFGQVRVHTGSQADQLNRALQARAFTTGPDVFFRQGAYAPGTAEGKKLIAHELAHVVQQGGAGKDRTIRRKYVTPPRMDSVGLNRYFEGSTYSKLRAAIVAYNRNQNQTNLNAVIRAYGDVVNLERTDTELDTLRREIQDEQARLDRAAAPPPAPAARPARAPAPATTPQPAAVPRNTVTPPPNPASNGRQPAPSAQSPVGARPAAAPAPQPAAAPRRPLTPPAEEETTDVPAPAGMPSSAAGGRRPPGPAAVPRRPITPPAEEETTDLPVPSSMPSSAVQAGRALAPATLPSGTAAPDRAHWTSAALLSDPQMTAEHQGLKTYILAQKHVAGIINGSIGKVNSSFAAPVEASSVTPGSRRHRWGVVKQGAKQYRVTGYGSQKGYTITAAADVYDGPKSVFVRGAEEQEWGIVAGNAEMFQVNGYGSGRGYSISHETISYKTQREVHIRQPANHGWGVIHQGAKMLKVTGYGTDSIKITGDAYNAEVTQYALIAWPKSHSETEGYIITQGEDAYWMAAADIERKSGPGFLVLDGAGGQNVYWVAEADIAQKEPKGFLIAHDAEDKEVYWVPAEHFEDKTGEGHVITVGEKDYWVPEGHYQQLRAGFVDKANIPLFPDGGPKPDHIKQGELGNCYLLAALASITAKDSSFPEQMMHDNEDGTVTVRLYEVTGTDRQYYTTGANIGESVIAAAFAATPKYIRVHKSIAQAMGRDLYAKEYLWVQMVEKAYARSGLGGSLLNTPAAGQGGDYANISGGSSKLAFEVLLGQEASFINVPTMQGRAGYAGGLAANFARDIYNRIDAALRGGEAVAAGTRSFTTQETRDARAEGLGHSGGEGKLRGIVSDHAYTVLKVWDGNKIKLRNPWGSYGRSIGGAAVPEGGGILEMTMADFLFWFDEIDFSGRIVRVPQGGGQ